MKKTLRVLNELEKKGIIQRYAMGGAVASLFYMEPVLTYDLDVFVFLHSPKGKLLSLAPIYECLRGKGYTAVREHVVIEGVPVQFIPAYNALVEEAVKEAKTVRYQGIRVRVLLPEHLVAIMLQTFRPKDRSRIPQFLEEAKLNRARLSGILGRHGLKERWDQLTKGFHAR